MHVRSIIILIFLALSFITVTDSFADIINVPDDYNTIQDAIDHAGQGDTVLVSPGTYQENLEIGNTECTLASLYLTTGNEAYIDSTVIDGSRSETSVIMINRAPGDFLMTGFTVTGGGGASGAGIRIVYSECTLSHLIVTENVSSFRAGGIYCDEGADVTIEYVHILDNEAGMGGGLYIQKCDPVIHHCVIAGNSATGEGGGVYDRTVNIVFENLTCTNNTCDRASNIYLLNCDLEIYNTIMWDNPAEDIFCFGACNVTVDYCDLEDGEDGIYQGEVDFGEHNIDEDPVFVDPDEHNYHLDPESPCIDAGNPESPRDPDGSIADIGALSLEQFGAAAGYVYDASDNNPVSGALIRTSSGQQVFSDSSGYWQIIPLTAGVFDITASASGFNDSTLFELEPDPEDTLEIDFYLLHPEILITVDNIESNLQPGESESQDFSILNQGNGKLEWSIEKLTALGSGLESWAALPEMPLSEAINDPALYAVAYGNDRYFIAGRNPDGEAHLIYVLNPQGELIGQFAQPNPEDRYGMKDLAWDCERGILWGGIDRTVYGLSEDGELVTSFPTELRSSIQSIAWDAARGVVWVGGVVTDIEGYTPEGENAATVRRGSLRNYGMAFWPEDPDTMNLYLLNIDAEFANIYRCNPEEGDWSIACNLDISGDNDISSLYITSQYQPLLTTCMSLLDTDNGYCVSNWLLDSFMDWITLEPELGELDAEGEQEISTRICTEELEIGEYAMNLAIHHNAAGESIIIPVQLTVAVSGIAEEYNEQPSEFGLLNCYPNPFNSTTTISYSLPIASQVSLKVFDLSGREVKSLTEGYVEAGHHSVSLSGEGMASGVYLVRMNNRIREHSEKLLLLK